MEARFPETLHSPKVRFGLIALICALACLRICHIHLLWADEDYHIAAALNILHGKVPYRDFWYDKPPLNALYYLIVGAWYGWLLRLLDSAYILLACFLAFRVAKAWWGESEGWIAALLLAFFTAFYLPSAVIPFAADALMLVPHLAAIYYARMRRPFWCGAYCGLAFLINNKAIFVLATCAAWLISALPALLAGFALPLFAGFVWALSGAWSGYYEQVWRWSLLYAKQSPVAHPFRVGTVRTLDWLGFHAAIAVGAIYSFLRIARHDRWMLGLWIGLSFVSVCLGTRFAPHYFLQLLPPVVIAASRGIALALKARKRIALIVLSLLLAVPFVRFAPRYALLAFDAIEHQAPRWSDVTMDLDSQQAAQIILSLAKPGDTLFVWGYRPDLYVYTRMCSDNLFWDSQPLTGVPADRHLSATTAIYSAPAKANRLRLAQSHPTFLVDGLGLINPKLRPAVYPELASWLAHYRLIARTKLCLIYRRIPTANANR